MKHKEMTFWKTVGAVCTAWLIMNAVVLIPLSLIMVLIGKH